MPAAFIALSRTRQLGSSALEFILVAVPILLVGLGTIELSRWFFTKQALSLALLEAGRAAIVDHARPSTIESAFEQALLPLYPATNTLSAAQRLQQAFSRRRTLVGVPPWIISIRSPNQAAYIDFANPHLAVPGAAGLSIIDNNYQAEQHQANLAQGLPEGRGPASGLTIFEANDLALDLIYMHEPSVPGLSALMRLLSSTSNGYTQSALAGGFLPLRQTLFLPMQSHPVAWRPSNDKVLTHERDWTEAVSPSTNACVGLWCDQRSPAQLPDTPGPILDNQQNPSLALTPIPSNDGISTDPSAMPNGSTAHNTPIDDALCGVVLCCIGA